MFIIKILRILLMIVGVICFTNCTTYKTPFTSAYFKNSKKVGIIFELDTMSIRSCGKQSVLEYLLTGTKKLSQPLKRADSILKPTSQIRNLYPDILSKRGKDFIVFNDMFNSSSLKPFKRPKNSKNKYYRYDLRWLKNRGISELMIIKARYGIDVYYDSIWIDGYGTSCDINTQIIDLFDNSIIYKGTHSEHRTPMDDDYDWKIPRNYPKVTNALEKVTKEAIQEERNKIDIQ